MKTEIWNGHQIRFVEHDGEWWAVAKDVANALGYANGSRDVNRHVDADDRQNYRNGTSEINNRGMTIVSECGIYALIFGSHLKEAHGFKRWVRNILKELRKSSGLAGFEVFRMLDKTHQKDMMKTLRDNLPRKAVRVDFIKANTITNKAVSMKHGYERMVKKGDMTPEMLVDRQTILEDTVQLMTANEKFELGVLVSERIYATVSGKQATA